MQHKSDYKVSETPNRPGVYVFRDKLREVIYVGKAKSLRKRLASYFQPSRSRTADAKLRSLINSIEYFELFPVRTEDEALVLESRFIKQYAPRYNIVLRDDKRFLLVKLDTREPFPAPVLVRMRKDDNCLYFGPFPKAGALRETLDFLVQHFGLRTCKARYPGPEERKHCSAKRLRTCCGPCDMGVTPEEYRERVDALVRVLEGKGKKEVVAVCEERMAEYAAARKFELAARMRDVIENIAIVFDPRNRSFARSTVSQYPGMPGVEALGEALHLPQPPRHIECFDISNTAGTQSVGSLVCFRDGQPAKKDYRHFTIKTVDGINDFAMMAEVVTRRYRRTLEGDNPVPDLIVVDGGKGQLSSAYAVLAELDLAAIPLIGLAKRQEEVFTTESPDPVLLAMDSPALKLLQSIRDEAHRFAINFHRKLRRKRIMNSMLDEIPGVGKKRKEMLLKEFGSVRNLRTKTPEELIRRLPGIGQALAEQILAHIKK